MKSETMSVEQQWKNFANAVLSPSGVSLVQKQEMRKAYYAGFVSAINMMEFIASPHLNEKTANTMLKSMEDELKAFAIEIGCDLQN